MGVIVGLVQYYKLDKKRLLREINHYRSAETALHAACPQHLVSVTGCDQLPLSSPYMVRIISYCVALLCSRLLATTVGLHEL